MKLKYALFVGMTFLPAFAFAQSAGTVSLPKGNQINTPASVSAAVNAALQTKADTNNGVLNNAQLQGVPTAPTASAGTSSTQISTTAFTGAAVAAETTRATAAEALKAPLASPTVSNLTATGNAYLGTLGVSPTTNGVEVISVPAGGIPTIQGFGADATKSLQIYAAGGGHVTLGNSIGGGAVWVTGCGSICTTQLSFGGGNASSPGDTISSSVTNTPVQVTGSGTGNTNLGSSTSLVQVGAAGLSVGSSTPVNLGDLVGLTGTTTWSGSTNTSAFNAYLTETGASSNSAPSALDYTCIDSVDYSGPNTFSCGGVENAYGGGGTAGSISSFDISETDNQGLTSDQGVDHNYTAAIFTSTREYTQGGTATTVSGAKGRVFGANPVANLVGTASNYYQLTGQEIDVANSGTSSEFFRSGLSVVSLNAMGVTTQGTGVDAGILEYLGANGNGEFHNGLEFGSAVNAWPVDQNVISASQYATGIATANWGVDFNNVAFPSTGNGYDGGFLRSPGYSVDGAGMVRQGACYSTPSTSGLAIDCKGAVGNIASGSGAINNAGSGFTASTTIPGSDQYGGRYTMTANTSGTITGITVNVQPTFPTTSGMPTTLPITASVSNPGTGLVLNASWNTTGSAISLNPTSKGIVSSGGPLQLATYTVAMLPACSASDANSLLAVTDATAPTYNGTLTGGGTLDIPVFCNGTAWTAH